MNAPVATTKDLPNGAWSVALRDQLAKEAIARMGPDASQEHKLAVMAELVEKLKALRESDRFDPKQLESVVAKWNYREVERILVASLIGAHDLQVLPDGRIVLGCQDRAIRILSKGADDQWNAEVLKGHAESVSCLQYLSDGRIVSGSYDSTIRIWTKGAEGEWSSEVLSRHGLGVHCLQALPDGRIVSGSSDKTIRIWTKGADGDWSSQVLSGHTRSVDCLQYLPDGRIVSGSYDDTIRIWTKGADGEWNSEVLRGHTNGVTCLQYLPDGRIVSGSADHTIRIWTKGFAGRWAAEVLPEHRFYIRCLQVLPDGRIVSGDGADHVEIWAKTPVSTIEGFLRGLAPNLFERQWTSWVLGDCDHSSSVNTVQVLPDGRIVSGSDDGTIRIWDGEEMPGGKS